MDELVKYKNRLLREGYNVSVTSREVTRKTKEKIIIYRIYNVKTRKIEIMTTNQIEKALKLISQRISYLARGRVFGTVEVRFRDESTARQHSASPLQADEVMLQVIYFGRYTFRIRVEESTRD